MVCLVFTAAVSCELQGRDYRVQQPSPLQRHAALWKPNPMNRLSSGPPHQTSRLADHALDPDQQARTGGGTGDGELGWKSWGFAWRIIWGPWLLIQNEREGWEKMYIKKYIFRTHLADNKPRSSKKSIYSMNLSERMTISHDSDSLQLQTTLKIICHQDKYYLCTEDFYS